MKNINMMITSRIKKSGPTPKMADMAERTVSGQMNSFGGLFNPRELSSGEKEALSQLLQEFSTGEEDLSYDLNLLTLITSEVKAINNQAALLHGERIKKAQALLKSYKEGAFTAWMIATYGNRQTPYNLMQYFEFYEKLSQELRLKLEEMPRQAVYTLASREGADEAKISVVQNYRGETKQDLLELIRSLFPLEEKDRRSQNHFETSLTLLHKTRLSLGKLKSLSHEQKGQLKEELSNLESFIDFIKTR